MKEYTDEQTIEIYKNLPEDLKGAIFNVEMTKAVDAIGKKYNLYVDRIGILGNETGMVMLGVTKPKDFVSNLSARLGVSNDMARSIAEEINQQIFSKVRESLKKVHGIDGEIKNVEPQPPEVKKEDILKEIEKEEVPEIMKGTRKPTESPFEAKTKEEIFRMPAQESEHKYPQGDPYREPI